MHTSEINMMLFPSDGYWHERHLRESFAEIRSHGVDSVCLPFLESDVAQSLAWHSALAHEVGLAVYAMPGRVAGLFAAGPRPCSLFTLLHPEARMLDECGTPRIGMSGFSACVNHPAFIGWFYPFIEKQIRETGCDGLFFDEPKLVHEACWCPICVKKAGGHREALVALREQSMAGMVGRASEAVKGLASTHRTLVMCMPDATPSFLDGLAAQPAIDAIGVDGPVCAQTVEKTSLFDSAPRILPRIRNAGKQTFALVETFNIPASAHGELDANMSRLHEIDADVRSFNYYAHENDRPYAVMEYVWRGIAAVTRGAVR